MCKSGVTRGISRRSIGFTLVELLVVSLLLAVFAAVVTAGLADADTESRISAARHTTTLFSRQISQYRDLHGAWPTSIDPSWFRYGQLPVNPFVPDHRNGANSDVDGSNNPNKWHPDNKTTQTHPFWYNRANGAFRIRVPVQATTAQTLALYNAANDVTLPADTRIR